MFLDLSWSELPGRSGSLQAGLSLEFERIDKQVELHISPEGPNGLLANLDLINTVVRLAKVQSQPVFVNDEVCLI